MPTCVPCRVLARDYSPQDPWSEHIKAHAALSHSRFETRNGFLKPNASSARCSADPVMALHYSTCVVLFLLGLWLPAHHAAPALPAAQAHAAPMQPRVGCYWYPSYANRKLSTIEVGTCTYMDIAGLCFFDVDDNGRLGWETWDKGANMSCAAVFAATITDLRGALAKVPSLQPKWVFSSGSGALKGVFSNATLSTQLVKDLTNVSLTHGPEIVGGWAMDYETHYSTPAPAAVNGLTHFLRDLKASTGMGINWWSGFLYSFGNLANISAIRPYVDYVEFASYFSILDCPDAANPCTNPHTFELEDARRLVSEFGYSPHQILLGIGLTAYSYLNVSAAILPTCALQGSLLTSGPVCVNSGAHESGGGHSDIGGSNRTRWDGIQADVLSGRAIKGRSNLYVEESLYYSV